MLGGYGEFLYQTGMIDELQKQYVDKQTDLGVELIQQQKWVEAFKVESGSLLCNIFFLYLPDLYWFSTIREDLCASETNEVFTFSEFRFLTLY